METWRHGDRVCCSPLGSNRQQSANEQASHPHHSEAAMGAHDRGLVRWVDQKSPFSEDLGTKRHHHGVGKERASPVLGKLGTKSKIRNPFDHNIENTTEARCREPGDGDRGRG